MSLNLHEVDWQDWLIQELRSLPFDERVEILTCAIGHNCLASLLMSRVTPLEQFRLACTLRDVADRLEQHVFALEYELRLGAAVE
jgi:hypothetical protein